MLAKLDELTGHKVKKPVKAKYANPSQVWTGRGRKPLWVAPAPKAGKTLEDLAVWPFRFGHRFGRLGAA